MDIPETMNLEFIDQQYRRWKDDPESVARDWRFFFEGFDRGSQTPPPAEEAPAEPKAKAEAAEAPAAKTERPAPPAEKPGRPETEDAAPAAPEGRVSEDACTIDKALAQSRVEALKYRYRDLGHLLACLDPLSACPTSHPLLDLENFGLSSVDLDTEFYTRRFAETKSAPLREIVAELKATYCQSVGVEYMHLQDPEERRWLQDRMEPVKNRPDMGKETRNRILQKLIQASRFEAYLHKKYMGQTRFSLEGAESLIPMLDALLLRASEADCRETILGMAHRGRINVQTNILLKPYEEIFREFANTYDRDSLVGSGDVKYHNGYLTDIELANGRNMQVFLVNNPSHLESVDPVVEGVAYGRQDILNGENRNRVLPVLIHGDAAFAGQGVVMETLQLSGLKGYGTGGTVHIVINNQIGYTTLPENARSTRYSTDVAKMLMVPIFHVHGENPEAVVHVVRLACDYRMAFGKDVVLDLVCYRRYGHNEGDEPYFTQPTMYDRIKERPPVPELYAQKLEADGEIAAGTADTIGEDVDACLEEAFEAAQNNPRVFPKIRFYDNWEKYHGQFSFDPVETGVDEEVLTWVSEKINAVPEDFTPHSKLKRLLDRRQDAVEKGRGIDWAGAELLAFATLLREGRSVRLSGQDSGRGTFSQRHAVLVDKKTGAVRIPLRDVARDGATFDVLNSSLSETGVLGFEYGYSLVRPEGLTIWEAQFGDFANNAQSVIDLYIVAGQAKWQRLSGLVMLLPHGWEGLGPEHSSARLERFLQLAAEENIQVVNLTTPAQYFHLLRRQALADWRKPLVVMAPKSLLRSTDAVSRLSHLAENRFHPVLGDEDGIEKPHRVVFCTGKIYYQLRQRRDTIKANIPIIRVEQLYPFPRRDIWEMVQKYRKAEQWFWVQEEPENMGAWRFMEPRLRDIVGTDIGYVGRDAAASPATGFANLYKQQQGALPDNAIGQLTGVAVG
ncbi:MAG: 2-oxoglutarate dehydrogenase E1 component [Desulfococcaceae bacterium]